jgi:RNA polymerase sigma factor (sigma-70 family)
MTELSRTTSKPDLGRFRAFYEDRHDEVVRALAVTLQDPSLARDAAQEAFTRCLERWDKVSGYANPSGWVYRVGLNWSRSWISRRSRERRTGGDESSVQREMPLPPDRRLVESLQRLPVGQHAVLVLRFYLDWSVNQTAEALGVSPGTVKSRQHRALTRLAASMEVES